MFMPDRIHYTLDGPANPPVPDQACTDGSPIGERMFGVALSGGGSRAAVFAAAGFEALWEHGLLEQITHVSSVSGGSMASSFLVANKPECDRLTGEGERDGCWRAFFADFQDAMRRNYINRVYLRQLMPNRFLSPTRRVSSLQEEMDKRFLHHMKFSEIEAGPASGDQPSQPVLLINGSSYDASRRFVFANTCFSETAPHLANGGRSSRSQAAAQRAIERDGLRALSFSSNGCARPTPGDFPLSLAAATSAAFPGAMGPVTIQAPDSCQDGEPQWWHLGDGGVIENSGIDTLEEVVLRDRAAGGGLDRVFLLALDAGKKTTPRSRWALRNVDMWTSPGGISTVVDAPRAAAREYHDVFWRDMRTALDEDGIDFVSIILEYTTANLERWPTSCSQGAEPPGQADFEAIPTNLKISTCHADLLVLAAHQIVHEQMNGNAGRSLEEMGIPVRRVDE
jgi:predicted acylesterase/phospholipase RssA